MPRVVTIQTRFHDPNAVAAACRRLDLPAPVRKVVCFPGRVIHGYLIEFQSCRSTALLDPLTGLLRCEAQDGEELPNRPLNRFLRAYVAEKASRLARQPEFGLEAEDIADLAAELMEMEVS
jgi:hypothetical protein